ncbi:MAG TPA: hypothetical protein IAA99_04135 [Candidatus Avibacteroides faecavium]|nr:hypothetical protein [Candidatus Avibacteroides faecavium]
MSICHRPVSGSSCHRCHSRHSSSAERRLVHSTFLTPRVEAIAATARKLAATSTGDE